MPTNRTRRSRHRAADALTPEAVLAWQRGDFHALAAALSLLPCSPHPWPLSMTALGWNQGPCPANAGPLWRAGWPRAQELQRALYEAAGEPLGPVT